MNVCVIGATGKLGKALMQQPHTVECDVRFDEAHKYGQWFDEHPEVNTVWHVARACRQTGIRRDADTFMLEQDAMQKLLNTRAKECRFVYASTKVVYGITSNEVTPMSANQTARAFTDDKKGISNFPEWKTIDEIDINGLGTEHLIYAMTKLTCERFVSSKCDNYKIVRIWDII